MSDNKKVPEKKKKKRTVLKIVLIALAVIIVVPLSFVGITTIKCKTYSDPVSKDKTITNNTGLVQQEGASLYDKNGNRLILKGVNCGACLVSEGWLVPYSAGEKLDEDGNIVYDSNNIPQYPVLPQETAYKALQDNPNLTSEQRSSLIDNYRANWFSDYDFKVVKNDLGYNAIRLPFYWRDILNYDETNKTFSRKSETEAFSYFDWFLNECKTNNLYLILDLHGVPGSQNGYEHSGLMQKAEFWSNESYINAAVDIWDYISSYYTNTQKDLGKYIATYDLLNEPCSNPDDQNAGTTQAAYPIMDKIYKAIRNNNDNHVITIEGVWDFSNYISPDEYSWKNIQYEAHIYNWNHFPTWLFLDYYEMKGWGHYQNDVPYSIGEFTCFDNENDWKETLGWFDKRGYSYQLWNYKTSTDGYWTTTWSIYTEKLNLQNGNGKRVNLKTATYYDLIDMGNKTNTNNCTTSNTYGYVRRYQGLEQ